jgi:uncharacterized protein YycO
VGDVVFLNTTTWRGRFVRFIDPGPAEFAHVGIIVRADGAGLQVAHAAPEGAGMVLVERLDALLLRSEITSAVVYRPRISRTAAGRAAAIAVAYANARTPFDHEFRLHDDRTIYCTELVWLSFRAFGLDVNEGESILFPSDLIASGFFAPAVARRPDATTASASPRTTSPR